MLKRVIRTISIMKMLILFINNRWIADACGRKWTIIGLGVPSLLSWLLIIFGRTVWVIYVARILAGISMGGYSVVSPMYIGEIAEASIRGALGSYFEVKYCR